MKGHVHWKGDHLTLEGVRADESWQKPRGAEFSVRAADLAYDIDGRRVVEEDAPTAVDLGVDEPRQQQMSAEVVTLRRCAPWIRLIHHIENPSLLEQHASAFDEPILA